VRDQGFARISRPPCNRPAIANAMPLEIEYTARPCRVGNARSALPQCKGDRDLAKTSRAFPIISPPQGHPMRVSRAREVAHLRIWSDWNRFRLVRSDHYHLKTPCGWQVSMVAV